MKAILLLMVIFLITAPTLSNADAKAPSEEPALLEKIDKDLHKAQKVSKDKLSEIDDNLTKESQKWNKKILGSDKAKKSSDKAVKHGN